MGLFLVTGAAGFIGAALAKRLISEKHQVITIDNLSTGYLENVPEDVDFIQGHCQDQEIYTRLPPGRYEAIFHIAAQSSGEISFDDPVYDLRTNTESTLHLLKFALSVGCCRFIYVSSMSVYDTKPDRPVREDDPAIPLSFYGVGKLASEHYLRLYEQYGIRSTSLRLFNVYGPGQSLKNLRQGMVSIYLAQMVEKQHIIVKGHGERFRDFVYIDDAVEALMLCLSHPESMGKVINIATGKRVTVNEMLQKLIALYPQPVTYEFTEGTPGDMHGIYGDITLARHVLGYKPGVSLDDGLKRMLDWAMRKKA